MSDWDSEVRVVVQFIFRTLRVLRRASAILLVQQSKLQKKPYDINCNVVIIKGSGSRKVYEQDALVVSGASADYAVVAHSHSPKLVRRRK